MARKSFALNKEPHVAELGDDLELHFVPEVMGDEFLDGYVQLQAAYKEFRGVGSADDPAGAEGVDIAQVKGIIQDLRGFIFKLLMPESQDVFARFVVLKGGKEMGTFHDRASAESHADRLKGATVKDESVQLPMRALMEILEWIAEIYGGGRRPTGSSTASAPPSRRGGKRGTATSPSKG